jgi:DNA-binding transcriptional MerR regulator/methylmalonyl-CoA mutase cobalamin-binding subunit
MPEQPLHTIQIAVARTGLSAHVIRVWERRYSAVTPHRDGSDRRLYSEAEIDRLTLLRDVNQAGHSIGTIAKLDAAQLQELLSKSRHAQSAEVSRAVDAGAGFRASCLEAIRQLDGTKLEQALARSLVALGHQGLLQVVIAPLAEQVGVLWRDGSITAAHEHFFTASAKIFLGQLSKQYAPGSATPGLVVSTPVGQLHELGAFMAGVAATHLGWRVTYLGTGLPAAEIAGAALQNNATAVALSIIYPEDDPHLPDELLNLRRYLASSTRIIVGGRAAPAYAETLTRIGAIVVSSLTECCEALDRVRKESALPAPGPRS